MRNIVTCNIALQIISTIIFSSQFNACVYGLFQYATRQIWKIFYLSIFQKPSLYYEKLINQILQKELILHLIPLLDITHIISTKCFVRRYDLLLVK